MEEQTEAQSNGSYGSKSVPAGAHSEDQQKMAFHWFDQWELVQDD